MKIKILLLLIALISSLNAQNIKVAVAANLSYAMKPLTQAFHQLHPDIKVDTIIGGTGKLFAQIQHHAPFDLLLSANMLYPEKLYQSGDAITRPIVYAQGSLVLLSTKDLDLSQGLNLLKDPSIKKIAIANPKTAPYGIATIQALKHTNIYDTIKSKFVYGESISQTLTYATRVADIGFIAKSALFAPAMKRYQKGTHWVDIDPKLYSPIDQGIVLLRHAKRSKEASAFYAFMLSRQAKVILESFGYRVP